MKKFFVSTLSASQNPQSLIWCGMHQCYSSTPVFGCPVSEERAGQIVVEKLLKGGKGHYGPLEHANISLSCANLPHSVIVQVTRHRLATFDVQSFRYTSITNQVPIDDVFYFRAAGEYTSREGGYQLNQSDVNYALEMAENAVHNYCLMVESGIPCEVARGVLPYDYRQHFIMTLNARSLMHFLDMRHKPDAQLEIQELARLVLIEFQKWMPQIADWYVKDRLNKGRLAP